MNKIVNFQDEVKHNLTGVMGTVISLYMIDQKVYIDVRSAEFDKIFYKSPIENWTVVRTQFEIEGTTD